MKKFYSLLIALLCSATMAFANESIPTIAEVIAMADLTATKVQGTVTYVAGTNFWIQDATAGILCYCPNHGLKEGELVTLSGEKVIYKGSPELTNVTVVAKEAGKEVGAQTVLLAALYADSLKNYKTYLNELVYLEGVTISGYKGDYKDPYITDGFNEIALYNWKNVTEDKYPVGTKISLKAVLGIYNKTIQLRGKEEWVKIEFYYLNVHCNEAQGTVSGGGEYELGTQVTITATANEGYQFSYWRKRGAYNIIYENPYTFEMGSQFYDIEAVFEKAKVLVDGVYYYLNDDNTAYVTSSNDNEYYGDIVIPETITVGGNTYTVTTIGEYAFDNAYITSVNIPATVTYVAREGFYDCYQLRTVKFNSMTPPSFSDNYLLNDGYCGKRINVPCGATEAYENALGTGECWYFAEGEYVLNVYAEQNVYGTSYVEIRDNIGCNDNQATIYAYTYDDDLSFKQWSDGNTDNPRTITVTSDTTFVAEFARSYNVSVYSGNEYRGAVIGGGKYFVGDEITVIATPNEGYVFDYWYDSYYGNSYYEDTLQLEIHHTYNLTAYFKIVPTLLDGIYYYLDKENYSAVVAPSGDYTGDIVLPETVTHNRTIYDVTGIDYGAFEGTSITSLVVPNNIYSEIALYECYELKVIKGNADFITDIDGLYDTNVEEVYMTGGYVYWLDPGKFVNVEVLDLSATENTELERGVLREDTDGNYEGFYNLRKLVLPNGLTTIHDRQFESLWSLEEIVIPEGITEIPDGAFYNCHALAKVELSKNLTSIGKYVFYSCHALENIVIPEGVTEIGDAAFFACTYLEEIELPSTLKNVGNNTFALCSKVKAIKAKAHTPPALYAKSFYEVDRNIPVYVAELAYDDYVEDQYWGEFFNIIPTSAYNDIPTDVENSVFDKMVIYTQGGMLYIEGVETDYNVFDASGRLVYSGRDAQLQLPRGVYMIAIGDKIQKVVL